jgi:hypothetical protein
MISIYKGEVVPPGSHGWEWMFAEGALEREECRNGQKTVSLSTIRVNESEV